nr:hypothetical protein [Tanacetum cinerariifolium]
MVPDSMTEDANVQAKEKCNDLDVDNSLDPFELYPLLNKKRNVEEKMDKSNGTVSIPFPPRFTPCDEREVECDKKSVVKERTTATAITEDTWGFEHTKACFRNDNIPFVKSLKELFTSFDQCLIDEVTEVQNVFTQMELAVEQHYEEKTKV